MIAAAAAPHRGSLNDCTTRYTTSVATRVTPIANGHCRRIRCRFLSRARSYSACADAPAGDVVRTAVSSTASATSGFTPMTARHFGNVEQPQNCWPS
jgi:hypothetical protein